MTFGIITISLAAPRSNTTPRSAPCTCPTPNYPKDRSSTLPGLRAMAGLWWRFTIRRPAGTSSVIRSSCHASRLVWLVASPLRRRSRPWRSTSCSSRHPNGACRRERCDLRRSLSGAITSRWRPDRLTRSEDFVEIPVACNRDNLVRDIRGYSQVLEPRLRRIDSSLDVIKPSGP